VQSRFLLAGPVPVLLGAMWLSGCANQVKVTSAWEGSAPRHPSFTRVLVVGVSPDVDQRCEFEHVLAGHINSASTTAIASCDVVTQKDPLTRENIDQAIVAQQADGVVATILVSKKWEVQDGGSRDTRGGGYYKPTDTGHTSSRYGAYGVPVVYGEFRTESSIMTLKGKVEVTTRVYETRAATLIYTVDTKASDLESTDVGRATIATSIADRLYRDGLIR
jgi:hypothetical protein